ncbi:MAG: branched-chain amino acid ABC transporter permease [Rhizobiaceae bacterium MnEN-MB40S]|nr:MAG: branched-chain amino acid ABC transporter permease [Rhizobiaceae bacterium MnEN-MB40S]
MNVAAFNRILTVAFFAILFILPLVNSDSYIRHISIIAIMYAVLVSSWNVTLGYGGVFNFGHMAFFAIGAYATGVMTKTFDVSPWWGMPIGVVAAVIASVIVCLPVLRLKGIYVILVTFAFAQLCLQIVLNQRDLTGGNFGLVSIPPLEIGAFSFRDFQNAGYYYLALLLLVVTLLAMLWFRRSHFGRSVIAFRDNEAYAISRGLPLAKVRLMTFMFSAVFPGAVGSVYAQYVRSASPDMFGFSFLTLALSMLLLGGVGTIWGPIAGAFVFTIISELLTPLGPGRYLVTATLIVLVLRFFPGGLAGIPEFIGQLLKGRSEVTGDPAMLKDEK